MVHLQFVKTERTGIEFPCEMFPAGPLSSCPLRQVRLASTDSARNGLLLASRLLTTLLGGLLDEIGNRHTFYKMLLRVVKYDPRVLSPLMRNS
jgi:hypothetical protein